MMEDIPNWANYIAQDADGRWYAFKYKPYTTDNFFSPGRWRSISLEGSKHFIGGGEPNFKHWRNTLIELNDSEINQSNTMSKDIDILQSITDSMKAGEDPRNFKWVNYARYIWVPCKSWDEAIEKWLKGADIAKAEPVKSYTDQQGETHNWPVPMKEAPENGTTYFIPDLETGSYQWREWNNSGIDRMNLRNGIAQKTGEGAVKQAKALQAFSRE